MATIERLGPAPGRSRRRCAPWLAALWLCAPAFGAQDQPPTADELRCMYCISVVRAEMDLQRHMIATVDEAASSADTPEQRQRWNSTSAELRMALARLEETLEKLQAYMLPRMGTRDPFALADALRQGDADFQGLRSAADHADEAVLTRVSACENPQWLSL